MMAEETIRYMCLQLAGTVTNDPDKIVDHAELFYLFTTGRLFEEIDEEAPVGDGCEDCEQGEGELVDGDEAPTEAVRDPGMAG